MPRKARIDAPGALHHIVFKGIERRNIFYDDKDRNRFLERLDLVIEHTQTPCYAWALMPNHVHLLIKTGKTPISTVMRRLLTGYAVDFNLRHRRHGQLFQNRYKSILCQEDTYLLELVRYIHLNPVRARLVNDLRSLGLYPYSGHSAIMGKIKNSWQSIDYVLGYFGKKKSEARKKYTAFVEKGISQGKRPELTGGGLLRSMGGWSAVKSMRRSIERIKGDERILGDGEFVEAVLRQADESYERRYRLAAKGYGLDKIAEKVAHVMDIPIEMVWEKGRRPQVVDARSLLCYWAVRKLGLRTTELAKKFDLTQPAISISVRRGEKFALNNEFELEG